jgi:hypothetical protein
MWRGVLRLPILSFRFAAFHAWESQWVQSTLKGRIPISPLYFLVSLTLYTSSQLFPQLLP